MQTFFCVQTFRQQGRKLVQGQFYQFTTRAQAEARAHRLQGRVDGYIVYQIDGDAIAEFWEEPILLLKHGELPREIASDD